MLKNMDDPSLLGPNMAVALLTTLYGSLLANLVFQPLAAKLSLQTEQEIFLRQCVIEGVIGVQTGQNPGMVEERLAAFLSTEERLKRKKNKLEKGVQGVKEIEI
jgi:chemotaxis protein MotA